MCRGQSLALDRNHRASNSYTKNSRFFLLPASSNASSIDPWILTLRTSNGFPESSSSLKFRRSIDQCYSYISRHIMRCFSCLGDNKRANNCRGFTALWNRLQQLDPFQGTTGKMDLEHRRTTNQQRFFLFTLNWFRKPSQDTNSCI